MSDARAHFDEAGGALIARGAWHADSANALPALRGKTVHVLDGAGITALDTNGAWLLLDAAGVREGAVPPELRGFTPQHRALMELVARHVGRTGTLPPPRREG